MRAGSESATRRLTLALLAATLALAGCATTKPAEEAPLAPIRVSGSYWIELSP